MAVVDNYVNTDLGATTGTMAKMGQTWQHQGANRIIVLQKYFNVPAGDSDGSVYRIFDNVPSSYIPLFGTLANDAIAGFTVSSLGLWLPNHGAVVSNNLFMTAQSLAAALTSNSPKTAIDCMANLGLAATGKRLWELASATLTNPVPAYDIALLAGTRGANAGNISVQLFFAQD